MDIAFSPADAAFRDEARLRPRTLANGLGHVWTGADRLRHAGAEGVLSAAYSFRRRLLVPRLQRARRRLRPRRAANERARQRRPLHLQRFEDLDHARAI